MREAYIVDKNSIRNINRIYVGVAGKARKVIKGYVGVNGKARLMFERDKEIVRKSSINFPSSAIRNYAGGSVGDEYYGFDRAFISGGYTGYQFVNTVVSYDGNLTASNLSNLSEARMHICGTESNGKSLFAGGVVETPVQSSDDISNKVDAYDKYGTKSTLSSLNTKRYYAAGLGFNTYSLISGGYGSGSNEIKSVEAYYRGDTKLSNLSDMDSGRVNHSGAKTGLYALLAGGTADVEVYNLNLTKQTSLSASFGSDSAGSSILSNDNPSNDCAIFGNWGSKIMKINAQLTVTMISNALETYRYGAETINNTVLFACQNVVEGYNKDLTKVCSILYEHTTKAPERATAIVGENVLIPVTDYSIVNTEVFTTDYA